MHLDLRAALDITDKRDGNGALVPFSIEWVSLDLRRKNKPSEHRKKPAVVRCGAASDLYRNGMIAVKPVDGGHPILIHLDLITRVNNMLVV